MFWCAAEVLSLISCSYMGKDRVGLLGRGNCFCFIWASSSEFEGIDRVVIYMIQFIT